jgi:hypothetical protein
VIRHRGGPPRRPFRPPTPEEVGALRALAETLRRGAEREERVTISAPAAQLLAAAADDLATLIERRKTA